MKRALFVVAILVFVQGYAIGSDVTTFKDGAVDAVVSLETPEFSDLVEMSIPAESHIVKATVDIVSVPPDETVLTSPKNVSLYLDDTLLWRYDGQDYGYFGLQDRFTNDTTVLSGQYNASGGQTLAKVRLPKRGMDVKSATFDVDCEGQWRGLVQVQNLTGTGDFGNQVAGIGDVNNDSYDDIIIGAPSFNSSKGAAFIFFGGPAMDSLPDLVLNGQNPGDFFGASVAGGSDLNGDGIDDVVVGAPYAQNGNGDYSGQAYVFFGGNNTDAAADVTLSGEYDSDDFGVSVACAGDVNKDGFADVIVGADGNDNVDYDAGAAYIFFGNTTMDNTADVTLLGEYYEDYFGYTVSSAGDVNNDGAADVLVGAWGYDDVGFNMGKVYLFRGGASMDTTADLTILGANDSDQLGTALASAGDVNNDGYGDIIVGSQYDSTANFYAGAALIYYGGASMDSTADVTMYGAADNDNFGNSVCGAGDLNNDGFDDVIVGAYANDSAGSEAGSASIFFGGAPMNNISDIVLTGNMPGNYFGWSVAPVGDLNGDGFTGVIIGSLRNNARLYESMFGVKEPQVTFGQTLAWSKPWYFNDTSKAANFADMLNSYISSNYATGVDSFGNTYIDVPVKLSCKSDGEIEVSGLLIKYVATEPVPEFTDKLEAYKAAHMGEKDAGGNITVPFKIASETAGNVKLANLKITLDEAPRLLSPIPDFEMDEDSIMSDQINLREYFADDYDSIDNIQFALVSFTNNTSVAVELLPNGFLTIDASTGPANDNWTGVVEIQVNASDRWGSTTFANPFRVFVKNVPDAPVITSQPGLAATPGQQYIYNVTAVDGDGDMLTFDLAQKPSGMTIDPVLGNISWLPTTAGKYDISIMVSDGNLTTYQNYTIIIPNRLPVITNFTVPEALAGSAWEYAIQVEDPDGNPLNFSFITPVSGMNLDPKTGVLSWTPGSTGIFPVSVAISDGKDTLRYDFNVTVRQPNRNPKFTSTPITSGVEAVPYTYTVTATDDDGNPLTFSLVSGPAGMTINATSGLITWTPAEDGDFAVSIGVADGLGGEAKQEFTIKVAETAKPKVTVQDPDPLSVVAWKGKVTISGIVRKGTYDVSYVEVKVDSGSWKKASGNSTWSFDLDTTKLKNGPHTYSVRVFDSKNNSDEMPGVFIVNNVAAKGTDYTMWIILIVVVLVVAALAGAGLAMARKKPPAAQDAQEQEPAAGEGESEGEAAEEEEKAQEEEEKEEEEKEEKEEEEEDEEEEPEEEEKAEDKPEKKQ